MDAGRNGALDTIRAGGRGVGIAEYVRAAYGELRPTPCPFTNEELLELPETQELLVYLPARVPAGELCRRWQIPTNIDFDNEHMIRNAMVDEDQWFITSAHDAPELLYQSGLYARRLYEDEGLHGMDLRRYLAFAAAYRHAFGVLPDQRYWCFLLSGSYDRSGVSIVGFDTHGVLSHHGWMRNFRAKFVGSRYVVIPPRIEVTADTRLLKRAYRGRGGAGGRESDVD